ncbi:MAG: Holliday junction resolvase RuvX [Patescibacteria group bacterium]
MKLLGIDYGEVKIGLAIADTESGLALPYGILKNSGFNGLALEVREIINKEKIQLVVVGLPLNKKSQKSPQTFKTKDFGERLAQELKIKLVFYDERFTSKEAQRLKPGRHDDDVAAMLTLQGYLDSK